MKRLIAPTALVFIASFSNACSAQHDFSEPSSRQLHGTHDAERASEVIARKNGYIFSEADFQKLLEIEMALDEKSSVAITDQIALKSEWIEQFNIDPEGVLNTISEIYQDIRAPRGGASEPYPSLPPQTTGQGVANGHIQLRKNMASLSRRNGTSYQFSDQSFNSSSANALRSFTANSQIINTNSNDFSSNKSVYTFCADGTFHYYYGSAISVNSTFGGAGVTGTNEVRASGHWDAYTDGGNDALLIYSANPSFADESLNNSGLLALPIALYQEDLIQMGQRGQHATPDSLLERRRISGC